MTIDKNDPRLTAFALGELPREETAELEAALKNDPALQAEVDAIRAVADKLKTTLAEEPLPKTDPVRPLEPAKKPNRLLRRLVFYGSTAAIVLVLLALITPAGRRAIETARRLDMQNVAMEAPAAPAGADAKSSRIAGPRYEPPREARVSGKKENVDGRKPVAEKPAFRYWGYRPSSPNSSSIPHDSSVRPATPSPYQSLMRGRDKRVSGEGESSVVEGMSAPGVFRTDLEIKTDVNAVGNGPVVYTPSPAQSPPQGNPAAGPSSNQYPAVRLREHGGARQYGYVRISGKPQAGNESRLNRLSRTPDIIVQQEEAVKLGAIRRLDTDELFFTRDSIRHRTGPHNTEAYDKIIENEFKRVAEHPLSTFSIDVDTASYSMVRKMLTQGRMPVPGAVRLEELINYFDYAYQPPTDGKPFATHVDAAKCPWNEKHNLVRIGLKGRVIDKKERDPANLVFLLDVSGSMSPANKLPLLKDGMKMLVENLNEKDRVAIVVYAGASGLVLPSTECSDKQKILESLDRLQSGGSTNGGAGIQLAYATAAANYIEGGVNRVILCTDGDFNVGTTNQSELVATIEKKAKEGVFLTVLGFGMGNYKDSTLEKLADKGNGNYGYVDTINEAKKLLVEGLSGTLVTIAKDVKIQVEFNPQHVKGYRLLGYENRMLRKEDFNDDTKDAGEIGAGHTVTALYEIIPADSAEKIATPTVDDLKYQKPVEITEAADSGEMLTVKLRYKEPDGQKSKLLEFPVKNQIVEFDAANVDLKFASSVAAFGMILRGSEFKGDADYDKVIRWAKSSLGEDEFNYRQEFLKLVRTAKSLSNK